MDFRSLELVATDRIRLRGLSFENEWSGVGLVLTVLFGSFPYLAYTRETRLRIPDLGAISVHQPVFGAPQRPNGPGNPP